MNTSVIILLLVVLNLVIGGLWLIQRLKSKRSTKPQVPPSFDPSVTPEYKTPVPGMQLSKPKENLHDRLIDRLRQQLASNADLESSIRLLQTEFGDAFVTDEIIQAALHVGFDPAVTAKFMSDRKYSPVDIATMLNRECSLEILLLADIMAPFVTGDTSVRADALFELVQGVLELADDDEDLHKLPARFGCSVEESAVILYRNTQLRLGSVLRSLNITDVPDFVATLATELDIDFAEASEEYSSLREGDAVDFPSAAVILKACGKQAGEIIDIENELNGLSEEDDFDTIFSALTTAGFTNSEVMAGIYQSNVISEHVYATILQGAIESEIPQADILAFLSGRQADVEELDEEMREMGFEFQLRIDLLHAFLHMNDSVPKES